MVTVHSVVRIPWRGGFIEWALRAPGQETSEIGIRSQSEVSVEKNGSDIFTRITKGEMHEMLIEIFSFSCLTSFPPYRGFLLQNHSRDIHLD